MLGCDEGENIDVGGLEGGAGFLGGRWVTEEGGDGVRVGEVGCGGCVVDGEAEEGGDGGGGGGGHGGVAMVLLWGGCELWWLEDVVRL